MAAMSLRLPKAPHRVALARHPPWPPPGRAARSKPASSIPVLIQPGQIALHLIVWPVIHGDGARQPVHEGLRRVVERHGRVGDLARDRPDIDDRPALDRIDWDKRPAAVEDARAVRTDHLVPIRVRAVDTVFSTCTPALFTRMSTSFPIRSAARPAADPWRSRHIQAHATSQSGRPLGRFAHARRSPPPHLPPENASTIARPIPCRPPVTKARLPASRISAQPSRGGSRYRRRARRRSCRIPVPEPFIAAQGISGVPTPCVFTQVKPYRSREVIDIAWPYIRRPDRRRETIAPGVWQSSAPHPHPRSARA